MGCRTCGTHSQHKSVCLPTPKGAPDTHLICQCYSLCCPQALNTQSCSGALPNPTRRLYHSQRAYNYFTMKISSLTAVHLVDGQKRHLHKLSKDGPLLTTVHPKTIAFCLRVIPPGGRYRRRPQRCFACNKEGSGTSI